MWISVEMLGTASQYLQKHSWERAGVGESHEGIFCFWSAILANFIARLSNGELVISCTLFIFLHMHILQYMLQIDI